MSRPSTALAVVDPWVLAERLEDAHTLRPKDFQSRADVYAVILAGSEMGLPPMRSLRLFHVIKGKPTLSAEGMLAAAISAGIGIYWGRCDHEAATLTLKRQGHGDFTHTFSLEDAKRAGLTSDNWRKYPAAMLKARCISAAIRAYCPDVLGGIYTPEEMGDDGAVADEPDVIDVEVIEEPPAASADAGADEPTGPDNDAFAVGLDRMGITMHAVNVWAKQHMPGRPPSEWAERVRGRFLDSLLTGARRQDVPEDGPSIRDELHDIMGES